MAHHRRGRPKNARAGCLYCKPWKANGVCRSSAEFERFSDHRRRRFADEEIAESQRPSASGP